MSWEKLEQALIKTGLDYSRQGSYSDVSEYPPSFFTFWNYDTENAGFFDNESNKTVWFWNVYYYTNNPATLYSTMDELIGYAEEEGFIVEGKGYDIPSDRPDFIGRIITLKYVETH